MDPNTCLLEVLPLEAREREGGGGQKVEQLHAADLSSVSSTAYALLSTEPAMNEYR